MPESQEINTNTPWQSTSSSKQDVTSAGGWLGRDNLFGPVEEQKKWTKAESNNRHFDAPSRRMNTEWMGGAYGSAARINRKGPIKVAGSGSVKDNPFLRNNRRQSDPTSPQRRISTGNGVSSSREPVRGVGRTVSLDDSPSTPVLSRPTLVKEPDEMEQMASSLSDIDTRVLEQEYNKVNDKSMVEDKPVINHSEAGPSVKPVKSALKQTQPISKEVTDSVSKAPLKTMTKNTIPQPEATTSVKRNAPLKSAMKKADPQPVASKTAETEPTVMPVKNKEDPEEVKDSMNSGVLTVNKLQAVLPPPGSFALSVGQPETFKVKVDDKEYPVYIATELTNTEGTVVKLLVILFAHILISHNFHAKLHRS